MFGHGSGDDEAEGSEAATDLTLSREAALLFGLSPATLRPLTTRESSRHGRECRVSLSALEQAGSTPGSSTMTEHEQPAEVRRLAEALTPDRARAAELDRQLGYAPLTIGRLRSGTTLS